MDDKLQLALNNLKEAVDFLAKCRADMSEATTVGAYRDALDWIEEASVKVAKAWVQSSLYCPEEF